VIVKPPYLAGRGEGKGRKEGREAGRKEGRKEGGIGGKREITKGYQGRIARKNSKKE
jgi:hypothetical protein